MIKLKIKGVEAVFVGLALALKRAGRLTEMNFMEMLVKLEINKSFSDQNMSPFRLSKMLSFKLKKNLNYSHLRKTNFS